jgi:eukaryotic-like serine/threonine-protein kinase
MSDNKGRTMIGTVAPITRPGTSSTQPPGAPPEAVPPMGAPPGVPNPVAGPMRVPTSPPAGYPTPPPSHVAQTIGPPHGAPPPGGSWPGQQQMGPATGAPTGAPAATVHGSGYTPASQHPHSQHPPSQHPPAPQQGFAPAAAPGYLPEPPSGYAHHGPAPGAPGPQSSPGMQAAPGPHGHPGMPSQPGQLAMQSGHVAPPPNTRDFAASSAGYPPGYSAGNEAEMFVGQTLGDYYIKRKLAEGGMGVVYEGEHTQLGRRAAVKVLKLEFCRSADVVERFKQEARAVNAIGHENIVDIYDFGSDPHGRVFFVMEFLDGEPLSSRIRRGALPWGEAFPILDQMLRALKAAHDKGFVHRDLKPDNVWLRPFDGRVQVKLLDFGIAKLVGTDSPREKLTQTGSVIGTPHYMSPEQINGSRDVDHRTDIYALGVMMYEMFAGVTPFTGDTLQAVMTGHLFKDPPKLSDLPPMLGVPVPLAKIIDHMLVKDANARYENVAQVLGDLHSVNQNRQPTKARDWAPTSTNAGLPNFAAPAKKSKKGLVIGGLLAAAALAAGGIFVVTKKDAPGAEGTTPPVAVAQATTPAAPVAPPAEPPLDFDKVRSEALLRLRASLREAEPAVRSQGSEALAKVKDQPSIPPLTELTEKDPDGQVRGSAAEALGTLGATATGELLGKLEDGAPPQLKVWYASALARLGDKDAIKRLHKYAGSKDLAVSLKASLTLADLSQPGDKKTIAALKALAGREAELNESLPYAGAVILTKMAALRDASARKILYSLLESQDEGTRLAAAEGLAKLGDDSGKTVLLAVAQNEGSPNQLVAAVAQIPLGEYGGLDLITKEIGSKESGTRKLAARALGDIGEAKSLKALIALSADDKDWTVRIAAAAAIVAIVGLDPQVLAQASVDWTKGALESQDWAVRRAAADVLADIADEKKAVPLLAQAIADKDPKVRLAASKSAGKMKSADAVAKVVAAVRLETDLEVKEQQVVALGKIGLAEATDTLSQITAEPGRIGVMAAGSLIAVGDTSGKGKEKLEEAVKAAAPELRLAAVQAAQAAPVSKQDAVVPTLKTGVADKVMAVRFAAAEGLSLFNVEKTTAVLVLNEGLKSKDSGMVGRAMAALSRFGEKPAEGALTPAEMLSSADPLQRLAAVPVIRAMPAKESAPLLRRLVADPNQEVRRAGVDAIESVVEKDKKEAVKLYKPLVSDADPVVRSKASGQLSRLVDEEPPAEVAQVPVKRPDPPPVVAVAPPPAPPAIDPAVQESVNAAKAAVGEAKSAEKDLENAITEAEAAEPVQGNEQANKDLLAKLKGNIESAEEAIQAAAAKAEAAAKAASDAAGATPTPETKKLSQDALAFAKEAGRAAKDARGKSKPAMKKLLDDFTDEGIVALQMMIAGAQMDLDLGNLGEAQAAMNKASKELRTRKQKSPELDGLFCQLYAKKAESAAAPDAKRKLYEQAKDSCQKASRGGGGAVKRKADSLLAEINRELEQLP